MLPHTIPSSRDEDHAPFWEQRFCWTAWCQAHTLFVQRHPAQEELWRVGFNPEESAYLVAATVPVCPFCGGHLLTAANVMEGVDLDKSA